MRRHEKVFEAARRQRRAMAVALVLGAAVALGIGLLTPSGGSAGHLTGAVRMLHIEKTYDDGNTDPVEVSVTCDSGTLVEDGSTAAPERTVTGTVAPGAALWLNWMGVGGSESNHTCTVTETVPPGYTADESECFRVRIALGDVECTLRNTPTVPDPMLTVTKIVINDNGGTATEADFPLFLNGNPTGSGVTVTVSPGVVYTVGEIDPGPEYVGTIGGDCAPDGTITLAPGDNRTCTVTNDDVPPELIVTKRVTNDGGGTAGPGDFTLRVDGGVGVVTSGDATEVDAGVEYTVSEDDPGPPGYEQVSIGGDCAPDGTITLALAEVAECFIDNNYENGNGNGDEIGNGSGIGGAPDVPDQGPGTGGEDPGSIGDPGAGVGPGGEGGDPGSIGDPGGGVAPPGGLPATGSGGLDQPIASDGSSVALAVILGIVAAAAAAVGGFVLIRRRT